VDLLTALSALHDAPTLWCLSGPCSLVAWEVEAAGIDDLAASPRARERGSAGAREPDGTAWHLDPFAPPTHLVQLDYEGRTDVVRIRTGLWWGRDGRMHTIGDARLPSPSPTEPVRLAGPLVPAWNGSVHAAKVAYLRERIAAGDCYQVNLTLPVRGELASGDDLAVALALLRASPASFAGLIRRPGRPTMVSHSPECFLAVADGTVMSCPIKGTRRAEDPDDLLAHPKDRAELAMIVDLMRNDLGRVAQPGTVQVTAPVRLLHLPYVRHLVADITAELRPGTTWKALLSATFPAGSITGAPKAMAMQHIAAIEVGPRGAYCGSFGWISERGGQLAVAIRTLEVSGSIVTLHAGSGITADSDGAAEWDEVLAKAGAMARALGGSL
jgi:anthranilate/para-aminobenzoate synthase component I